MGYETKIDPKVSKIGVDPKEHGTKEAAVKPKTQAAARDDYAAQRVSGYRKLVEGRKPEPYYNGVQAILDNLRIGGTAQVEHEVPYVPDLQKDIFARDPERHNDMKPVVKRYVALEKVLIAQLIETRKTLKPVNMSRLSASEIKAQREHEKDLMEALRFCRQQLDLARLYLQWEKENKAAEAEKLKKQGPYSDYQNT